MSEILAVQREQDSMLFVCTVSVFRVNSRKSQFSRGAHRTHEARGILSAAHEQHADFTAHKRVSVVHLCSICVVLACVVYSDREPAQCGLARRFRVAACQSTKAVCSVITFRW